MRPPESREKRWRSFAGRRREGPALSPMTAAWSLRRRPISIPGDRCCRTAPMPGENATQRVTDTPAPKRPRARRWWPRLARSLRGRGLVRLRSSIGFRLVVLALALGVPFVAYVGGNAAHQASLERAEAKQRTLALAKLFAARVDDYVGDVLSALALIEHGASFDVPGASANDAFLQRVRADLPRSLNNVGVWTRDGR